MTGYVSAVLVGRVDSARRHLRACSITPIGCFGPGNRLIGRSGLSALAIGQRDARYSTGFCCIPPEHECYSFHFEAPYIGPPKNVYKH